MKRSYLKACASSRKYDRFICIQNDAVKFVNPINKSVRFDLYFSDYYDKSMLHEMLYEEFIWKSCNNGGILYE